MKTIIAVLALLVSSVAFAHDTTPLKAGTLGYFEIATKNAAAAQEFYGKLLGWTFTQSSVAHKYWDIHTPTLDGGLNAEDGMPGVGGNILYFKVDTLRSSYDAALKMGAQSVIAPMAIPGANLSFALLKDLDGNAVGIFSEK